MGISGENIWNGELGPPRAGGPPACQFCPTFKAVLLGLLFPAEGAKAEAEATRMEAMAAVNFMMDAIAVAKLDYNLARGFGSKTEWYCFV